MAAGDHDGVRVSPFSSDSSLPTSAHLTPDSDDDDDSDDSDPGRTNGSRRGGLPLGIDGDEEAYELQDRGPGRYSRVDRNTFYEQENASGSREGRGGGGRAISASSVASFELYTPDEERAVVRKFDRRLVLFLSLCYMLSFLDRSSECVFFFVLSVYSSIHTQFPIYICRIMSPFADERFALTLDIGNARIAGMEEDLQTSPPKDEWYDWALSSFYIAYIAFEWMSLLWKLIPAHAYVAAIVASWGVTASLQAVCTSYPTLIFLRAVLGIGEAAFTGVPFYLSFFFKRHELAFRTAIFISGMFPSPSSKYAVILASIPERLT